MKKVFILALTVLLFTASSCVPTTTQKLGEAGAECILEIAVQGVGVDTVIECLKTAGVKLSDPEVLAEIKEQLLKNTDNELIRILIETLVPSGELPLASVQSIDGGSYAVVTQESLVDSILESLAARQ